MLQMRIWTRKSALIQPRTSPGKSDGVVAHTEGAPAEDQEAAGEDGAERMDEGDDGVLPAGYLFEN